MSYSLDANLLIHAANERAPENAAAVAFLERCAERDEPLCLTWGVVRAFLRLITSPRVLPRPLTPAQAQSWLNELFDLPQVRVIAEEPGFWSLYCSVAESIKPRGADVADTHLAALLRQHGVGTLYTRDRGFRRFDFLKVVNPLEP